MQSGSCAAGTEAVALLAEGVDRNIGLGIVTDWTRLSPSSRRAWIEIALYVVFVIALHVALLAEGVDRNTNSCFP